ncbi:MAG: GreA/GreB family elongation factor [Proteobacteria bacterium]|nr:GreA/GreB family elongation factor [Pseudomonadota bacterium]
MSRAFVKEPDGDQAELDLPERPQSEHPNYITSNGLQRMKSTVEMLRQERNQLKKEDSLSTKNRIKAVEAELRYLEKRLQCAIPVDVSKQVSEEIRFGATVKLVDENVRKYIFTIVGEDEAEPDEGFISWISPLARALVGKKIHDAVIWERPAGNLELKILEFIYKNSNSGV